MVNTGYTTPITINKGAYTFSKNTYSYSLPNLLKKAGYTVNAFHMNTPEYYSRDVNYKSFGYDSFNSLKTQDYYVDNSYWLDTKWQAVKVCKATAPRRLDLDRLTAFHYHTQLVGLQ